MATDSSVPQPILQPRTPASVQPLSAQRSRAFLLSEFLLLFIGLPVALFLRLAGHLPPMPVLWAVALYCLVVLLRDPLFDRRQLWNSGPLPRQLPQILALFAAGVVVVTVLVRLYCPDLFLALIRTHPRVWALIMVAYPLFSVYPQGLIYRTFFFHRYRPLLQLDARTQSAIMVLISAATFALMHILFHNWVAVALTLPGGILFACRYLDTRSLCVSSVEHALYGCFLFTVGLGQFFYVRVV